MNFGGPYNWILGENLNEFLSLGYYNGWFPLEQLCYENEWVFKFYQGDNHEELESPEDELFTEKLRSKLGYGFIPLNEARLGELRKKYFHLLEFEDDRYGR